MIAPIIKQPVRLVAIVVTYNRLEALKVTLARLLANSDDYLQAVVVIDNASNDGTAAWLADQKDPRLCIERAALNLGGAGGFEKGMRLASDAFDPDWMCLMDDDARPSAEAFQSFLDVPRPEDAYAAAAYHPDGRICEMNRCGQNPFWHTSIFLRTFAATLIGRGRFGFHLPDTAYEQGEPKDVDNASFVGFFISRAGIQRVGFPEGRLFIYGDDVIYSLKLRAAGGRIIFDPSVEFEHACTTFATEGYSVLHPVWKVYYIYRNGLVMYRLAAGWMFWLILPLVLAKWALKGRRYGAQKRNYYKLLRHAIWNGLLRPKDLTHPEVLALVDKIDET